MNFIQPVLFIILTSIVAFVAFKQFRRIYKNIMLGRSTPVEGTFSQRMREMLLVALGQKKMFKNIISALLHLVIYVSFVITQIELIEILIDGASGGHRLVYHFLGSIGFGQGLYVVAISLIEIFSLLTFFVTIAFFWRRNMLKLPRFKMPELKGWPELDANLILVFEVILITNIFLMNGADTALHADEPYGFAISTLLIPFFSQFSVSTLHVLERIGWWGHISMVFCFLIYLPFSKHLHIMLAFPNTFFSRFSAKGYMDNMPEITREVRLMLDPNADPYATPPAEAAPVKFGAKDVQDLTWKNLLDAYTCTECGRCSSACPANQTGKKLSPRKIMMDTRDRATEVGLLIEKNGPDFKDGKQLLGDYITVEELRACTTCNACVEECPVNISPLEIILQMRRSLIMEDSNSTESWNTMFNNIENNGAPWQFSPNDRFKWADDLAKS